MSKPAIPQNIVDQAPKARIVQYRNQRYSLRLEPAFWRALERMAKDRGVRLGRFLVELEQRHQGVNFASFLRSYCMIEAEEKLASHSIRTTKATIGDVLINNPSAGCLLNENMLMLSANNAFYSWIGEDKKRIEGSNINSLLQIHAEKGLSAAWDELMSGKRNLLNASIVRVITGRVMTAKARLMSLQGQKKDRPFVLMWLAIAPKMTNVAPRPVASQAPKTSKLEQGSPRQ